MATYGNTTKYLLRKLLGSNTINDIDAGFTALADDVDANMSGYAEGTFAGKPAAGKAGRMYRCTDTGQVLYDTGAAWNELDVAWSGDIKATARATAPTGWLLCDGTAVSRTTYAGLFSAIGGTYGTGDGSTTFNVPDLRGRVPVGVDGAAARLAANDALGQSGGEEKHALTSAENGPHTHDIIWGSSGGSGPGIRVIASAANTWQTPNLNDTVLSSGSGTPHQNMQPYQIVNWMIKT